MQTGDFREFQTGLDTWRLLLRAEAEGVGVLRSADSDSAGVLGGEANSDRSHPPNNLPFAVASFVGRENELEAVARLLGRTRLLTLAGTGGCGKTRLALEAARKVADPARHHFPTLSFPDGVYLVGLAGLTEASLVPRAVADVLGVRERPGQSPTEAIVEYLERMRVLLLLDNCEHLLEASARLAEGLLRTCAELRILATSREPLAILGEVVWRVPSLTLPPELDRELAAAGPTPSSVLSPHSSEDAVRLFVARAEAVHPDFLLSERNRGAVEEICRRLDGLPLAIELAAARLSTLNVQQIAARLDARFRLLTGGGRTALPRQRTLRATLDWSYSLLTKRERVLFDRLAIFAGTFDLEAATAIADDAEEGPAARRPWSLDLIDLLDRLVAKSLVLMQDAEGEARYRLLETLREYGQERLDSTGERDALRRRHAAFYLALAEEADAKIWGPEQRACLERLEREHDNLRAALSWAVERGEAEFGQRLAGALIWFWDAHGHLGEGRSWVERVLAFDREAETPARARALRAARYLARQQGDCVLSRSLGEESLALNRALGDRAGIAWALHHLGVLASLQGDYAQARAFTEECLSIFRDAGDRAGAAWSLSSLANGALNQGDFPRAAPLLQECLALFRELGFPEGMSAALGALGQIELEQGNVGAARSHLEERLAGQRALGHRLRIGESLALVGETARRQGDTSAAHAALEEGLSLLREAGEGRLIAMTLTSLARLALDAEDREGSRRLLAEAMAVAQRLGNRRHSARALAVLGDLARAERDYAQAEAFYRESLSLRRTLAEKPGIADCLAAFAAAAVAQGQPLRATRLHAAAEALRRPLGIRLLPHEWAHCDAVLSSLRTTLGEAAYMAAWRAGGSLSLDASIDYALAVPSPEGAAKRLSAHAPVRPDGLSAREIDVLRLLTLGQSNQEIADGLVVSRRTAERHIESIYEKIAVHGKSARAAAAAYAVLHGLATPRSSEPGNSSPGCS